MVEPTQNRSDWCQRTTSLGTDREEKSSPVAVKAPDQEPDEAISGLKPGTGSRSEGDLQLRVGTGSQARGRAASEDRAEGGEEEADKFEHPHRLVDPAARVLPPNSVSISLSPPVKPLSAPERVRQSAGEAASLPRVAGRPVRPARGHAASPASTKVAARSA
jgi:hypothetical protein